MLPILTIQYTIYRPVYALYATYSDNPIYQLVELHNAVTFQMLHCVITFQNVTSCPNIVLLHMYVTLWTMLHI